MAAVVATADFDYHKIRDGLPANGAVPAGKDEYLKVRSGSLAHHALAQSGFPKVEKLPATGKSVSIKSLLEAGAIVKLKISYSRPNGKSGRSTVPVPLAKVEEAFKLYPQKVWNGHTIKSVTSCTR